MSKWFPKLYDTLMSPLERGNFKQIRQALIHKAQGQVLEIGSGTGINFPYYKQVEKVTAVEPNPLMQKQSLPRLKDAQVPIKIIEAGAESLPFPDDSFDTVISTLVFCTIPDPIKALQEIRRVCKPGGKVLFFEHVRLSHSRLGRLQDWLTPAWKKICDGCHLNRDTLKMVRESGLNVNHVHSYYNQIFLIIEAENRRFSS